MAARHEEGRPETHISMDFLVCDGISNDDVGVAKGTVFQALRPGAGFKTGDFVEEKFGGGTEERLKVIYLAAMQCQHHGMLITLPALSRAIS